MTVLPGSSGARRASRVHPNTCWTSTSQLRLNVCQVCWWIGRDSGAAPALSTRVCGRCFEELPGHDRVGRVGDDGGESRAELFAQFLQPRAVAGNPDDLRARLHKAMAMPRPKPRLAPVTTAVVPESSRDVMWAPWGE